MSRIDELLLKIVKEKINNKSPITYKIMAKEARKIANDLQITGFKASDRYLRTFFKQNNIIKTMRTKDGNYIINEPNERNTIDPSDDEYEEDDFQMFNSSDYPE